VTPRPGPAVADAEVAVSQVPDDVSPDPRTAGSRAVLRFGLVGQALTFAAMVLPIAVREGQQIAVLVFTSAIATALVSSALLGYQFVYPVIRGPRTAAVATRLALTALTGTSLLVLPLTLVESRIGVPDGAFAAGAALLFTMGLYVLSVTRLVRAADSEAIGLVRLLYGAALVVLTAVASFWPFSPLGLTLANTVAYVVPAVYVALRGTADPVSPHPTRAARRRLRRAVLRRSVRPTFSALADGWAFFLPGIALPGLGIAQQPWAIVTRICGGFSTVLLTIVAPPMEARMAKAVRNRDRDEYLRGRRAALAIGGAASLAALATGLGLALYQNWDTAGRWLGPVALAAALYFVVLLASQPIHRTPNFVGRHGARLVWDVARAVLVTVAFLTTDGLGRLMAIGAIVSVFGLLLLPLSRYRTAARP
jgi:hypothetical protein